MRPASVACCAVAGLFCCRVDIPGQCLGKALYWLVGTSVRRPGRGACCAAARLLCCRVLAQDHTSQFKKQVWVALETE